MIEAALFAAGAVATPVGAIEHFPTKCGVGELVAGPDGNVWFSCYRRGHRPGAAGKAIIGRISPAGEVREFSAGIPAATGIGGLVAGPDGNLWFTLSARIGPSGTIKGKSGVGRITPAGEVSVFSAGLRKAAVPGEIVAGPGGVLWFVDNATPSQIGRVTAQGTITEFPTGLQQALGIGGLAPTPDGNLWFTQVFDLPHGDNEPGGLIGRMTPEGVVSSFGSPPAANGGPVVAPDGNVWFVEWVSGVGARVSIDRVTPGGEISRFGEKAVGIPAHLAIGPDGNVWFTAQQSIGRVTPSGQITTYTKCLDYRQLFSEATSIISGPGGDLWFASVTSRQLPSMEEPPAIGRVTPSGEITQFKDGLTGEPSSLVAGPDGRVWFTAGGEEIERITPPTAPVNTFIFAGAEAKASGVTNVGVEIPGPGKLELRPLALRLPGKVTKRVSGAGTVATAAPACGQTSMKLHLRGAALGALRQNGRLTLRVKARFTPTGGSPNTEVRWIRVRGPRHQR